jgi:hypothetical protein
MPATRIRACIYIGMARRKEHFIYAVRVLSHAILFRRTRSLTRVNDQEVPLAIVRRLARTSVRSIDRYLPGRPPNNRRVCFPYSVTTAHNRYLAARSGAKVKEKRSETRRRGRERRNHSIVRAVPTIGINAAAAYPFADR